MTVPKDIDQEISKLIKSLTTNHQPKGSQNSIQGKSRHQQQQEGNYKDTLKETIDRLLEITCEYGVSNKQLNSLIHIITFVQVSDQLGDDEREQSKTEKYMNELTSSMKVRLINGVLFPRSPIPEAIVIKIVGSMGAATPITGKRRARNTSKASKLALLLSLSLPHHHQKQLLPSQVVSFPDKRVQSALLKWLVCVSFFLSHRKSHQQKPKQRQNPGENNGKILSKLNLVLFNLLTIDYLRPYVCHLLFLSTERHMVKPWRIQFLQTMARKLSGYGVSNSSIGGGGLGRLQVSALLIHYQSLIPRGVINKGTGKGKKSHSSVKNDSEIGEHYEHKSNISDYEDSEDEDKEDRFGPSDWLMTGIDASQINTSKVFKYPNLNFLIEWQQVIEKVHGDDGNNGRDSVIYKDKFQEVISEHLAQLQAFEESLTKRRKLTHDGSGHSGNVLNNIAYYDSTFFKITQMIPDDDIETFALLYANTTPYNDDDNDDDTMATPTVKEVVWNDINSNRKFVNVVSDLKVPLQLNRIFQNNSFFQIYILSHLFKLDVNSDKDIVMKRDANEKQNPAATATTEAQLDQFDFYVGLLLRNADAANMKEIAAVLDGVLTYSKITGELIPSVKKFVMSGYGSSSALAKVERLYIWKFLPYLNIKNNLKCQEFMEVYEPMFLCTRGSTGSIEWTCLFLDCLCEIFLRNIEALKSEAKANIGVETNSDFQQQCYKSLFNLYSRFLNHLLFKSQHANHSENIQFLHSASNYIMLIDEFPTSANFFQIVNPLLVYRYLVSNNHVLIDKICRYVVYLKNYSMFEMMGEAADEKEKDKFGKFIELRNSYVLDICNALWRHRPFDKHNKTFGFFLEDNVIDRLKSSQRQLYQQGSQPEKKQPQKQSGENIFGKGRYWLEVNHNTALSSVVCHIIRSLEQEHQKEREQKQPRLSIKLIRPITAENFRDPAIKRTIFLPKEKGENDGGQRDKNNENANEVSDAKANDEEWLDCKLNYDDFRIAVLNQLSKLQYCEGIAELLFTSLKSLQGKRE